MEETPSTIIYPDLLKGDILVTSIREIGDIRRHFLFCLDFSLRGWITRSVKEAWPFNSLLLPINSPEDYIKGILLVKWKNRELDTFLLKAENFICNLSFRDYIVIPHWSDCEVADRTGDFAKLTEEISYRCGKKNFRILYGGKNE